MRIENVQGGPVSLRQRLFNGWEGCSNHGCVVVDPKPGMMRTNGSCQCVVNASRSHLYMLQGRIQSVLSATQQPAEQQPSPDVTELVDYEALQAECEKLRKDAERYRYIKKGNQWIIAATQTGSQVDGEDLDDLIDSEMGEQNDT